MYPGVDFLYFQVLGGGGVEELLTPDEKKRLEEERKQRAVPVTTSSPGVSGKQPAGSQDLGVAAVLAGLLQGVGGQVGGGGNSLLSLLAAGGKTKKRGLNKTNSPCFACQGFGHWADDPECPLQNKRNKPADKKEESG